MLSKREIRANFPSFSEGLSLRLHQITHLVNHLPNFPSFSEGLSLRLVSVRLKVSPLPISLPFRRDFH